MGRHPFSRQGFIGTNAWFVFTHTFSYARTLREKQKLNLLAPNAVHIRP